MYSSLAKLDLGFAHARFPFKVLVQTDHRSAAEICDDAALSVVFALTRCHVARAIGDADAKLQPFRVVYELDADPPAFLAFAVAAGGAHLVRTSEQLDATAEDLRSRAVDVVALIDDACARIAADTCRRDAIEPTLAGLLAWEQRLTVVDPDDDEPAYYAAIVTLGALAATVLRARFPHVGWRHAPGAVVPFALAAPNSDDATELRVFELAQRYVDGVLAGARDPTDAPSLLVGMILGEIKQVVI